MLCVTKLDNIICLTFTTNRNSTFWHDSAGYVSVDRMCIHANHARRICEICLLPCVAPLLTHAYNALYGYANMLIKGLCALFGTV